MLHKYSKVTVVAALAATVSAQNSSLLDGVSSTCKATLKGLLVSPDAQCLNTAAFISVAASSNVDLPAIANSWLTGLCSSGTCSSDNLAAIVKNVTTDCAEDIQTLFGIAIPDIDSAVSLAQAQVAFYYPSVRQIACLKDTTANTLCVPQTITSIQSITGPLGVDDLIVDNFIAVSNKLINSDYANLACTSCSKQAYNIAAKVVDPTLLGTVNGPITATCGASFIDGQNVTTVAQTAASGQFSVKTNTSGSQNTKHLTLIGTAFVVASSVLALLV